MWKKELWRRAEYGTDLGEKALSLFFGSALKMTRMKNFSGGCRKIWYCLPIRGFWS